MGRRQKRFNENALLFADDVRYSNALTYINGNDNTSAPADMAIEHIN